MPKSSDEIKELQRSLLRLHRLEGKVVVCAEGAFLVPRDAKLTDPRPLVASIRSLGVPSRAALRSALSTRGPLVEVSASALAAARHDLRRLRSTGALRAIRKAPRLFRKLGELDDRFLSRVEARVAELSVGLQRAPSRDWFEGALRCIAELRSENAAAAARAWARENETRATHRRRDGRIRIEALAQRLEGEGASTGDAALDALLDVTAARVVRLGQVSGRLGARRLVPLLRTLMTWPDQVELHGEAPSLALDGPPSTDPAAAVREVGAALMAGRTPRAVDGAGGIGRLREVIAHYALLFDPVAKRREGAATPLDAGLLDVARLKLDVAIDELAGRPLSVREAMILLSLDVSNAQLRKLATWVEQGVDARSLREAERAEVLEKLLDLEKADARMARAYCTWTALLVPHFRALGQKVTIDPSLFRDLEHDRDADMAVLAYCLIEQHASESTGDVSVRLATLDTTLGLFRRLPRAAQTLAESLSRAAKGAGRTTFPEFAAFLDDDGLLDRFVHLSRLAGEPVSLSHSLLRDFSRNKRMAGQREYLASVRSMTEAQRRRIERLSPQGAGADARGAHKPRTSEASPSPQWTRRRLQERVEALAARAYRKQLDEVLREILREVWGIAITELTPAWRDAVRFYLSVDDNRDHLATLLRFAARKPGVPIAPSLPQNQAWLARASERMKVDVWLEKRQRVVQLGERRVVLEIEQEPLEVLRMGIPFDTCLSLQGGCNAASTVVNALDANKRVIYLRDASPAEGAPPGTRGNILARKLIAVSKDFGLIGYEVYNSLGDQRDEVQQLFRDFCAELSTGVGLPLSAAGEPEQLHSGFWYDDGTQAFGREPARAEAVPYCEHLGQPVPEKTAALDDEALAFAARLRGDVDDAIARLSRWGCALSNLELGDWVVDRLSEREAVLRVKNARQLLPPLMRRLERRGPEALLRALGPAAALGSDDAVTDALDRFPASADIGEALLDLFERAMSGADAKTKPKKLEHSMLDALPTHLLHGNVARLLQLCERIDGCWQVVVERSPGCADCRRFAERRLIETMELVYARAPDPAAVIAALRDRKCSALTHAAALRVAARFPFPQRARDPQAPFSRLQALDGRKPAASIIGLAAVSHLRKVRPQWEGAPEMLAAVLRQGEGDAAAVTNLPKPTRAPFAMLAELLMVVTGLEPILSPWCSPDVTPAAWNPGAWELYWHRRHRTPFRARLAREARSRTLGAPALSWLAVLGDVEAVAAAQAARATDTRGAARLPPGQPAPHHPRIPDNARSRIARDVRLQIADEDDELPSTHRPLGDTSKRFVAPPTAVDIARIRRAFRAMEQFFDLRRPEERVERGAARAFEVLLQAWITSETWTEIVTRLVFATAGPARALAEGALLRWLAAKVAVGATEISPTLLARLWSVPSLREPLLDTLTRPHDHSWHTRCVAITRAGLTLDPPVVVDGLLGGWTRRLLSSGRGAHVLCNVDGRDALREVFRVACEVASPIALVQLFRSVGDFAARAVFLEEMARLGDDARAAIAKVVTETTWQGDDAVACRAWLDHMPSTRAGPDATMATAEAVQPSSSPVTSVSKKSHAPRSSRRKTSRAHTEGVE